MTIHAQFEPQGARVAIAVVVVVVVVVVVITGKQLIDWQ